MDLFNAIIVFLRIKGWNEKLYEKEALDEHNERSYGINNSKSGKSGLVMFI